MRTQKYYTRKEAVTLLRLNPRRLLMWVRHGIIPKDAVKNKELYKKECIDELVKRYIHDDFLFPTLRKNQEERNRMINENIRLVYHIASKIGHRDSDEVISCGTLGLIHAVDNYNDKKDRQFSTYATYCIRDCIFEYAFRPQRLDIPVSFSAIDAESIPEPIDYRNTPTQLTIEQKEVVNVIERYLDKKAFQLFYEYYYNGKTLSEVGKIVGLSKERVRQIIKRGIEQAKRGIANLRELLEG